MEMEIHVREYGGHTGTPTAGTHDTRDFEWRAALNSQADPKAQGNLCSGIVSQGIPYSITHKCIFDGVTVQTTDRVLVAHVLKLQGRYSEGLSPLVDQILPSYGSSDDFSVPKWRTDSANGGSLMFLTHAKDQCST